MKDQAMTVSDQNLWDRLSELRAMHRAAHRDDASGCALERLMAAALEHWGLASNAEHMGRMRDIYITREFRVQM